MGSGVEVVCGRQRPVRATGADLSGGVKIRRGSGPDSSQSSQITGGAGQLNERWHPTQVPATLPSNLSTAIRANRNSGLSSPVCTSISPTCSATGQRDEMLDPRQARDGAAQLCNYPVMPEYRELRPTRTPTWVWCKQSLAGRRRRSSLYEAARALAEELVRDSPGVPDYLAILAKRITVGASQIRILPRGTSGQKILRSGPRTAGTVGPATSGRAPLLGRAC